jgi:histone chaperone ASF1
MSSINILNIIPKTTKNKFTDPFSFEIIFEVLSELKKEIEWKMIYIGSAADTKYDQILETIEIDGPFHLGSMRFQFTGEAPDISKIPESEILGVTAIILCCTYNNQEFFRCGYYLNNIYDNEEMNLNPPEKIQIEHIIRSLLAEKPRITRFDIDWDNEPEDKNIEKEKFTNENFMFKDGKMDIQKFNSLQEDKNNEQTTENTN